MTNKKISIDISQKTILTILFVGLSVYFFRHLSSVLVGLFIAYIFSVAINPVLNQLEKYRIPRPFSAFVVLISFFSVFITLVTTLVASLISQTQSFLTQLPSIIQKLSPYFEKLNLNINLSDLTSIPQIYTAPSNVAKFALGTFSGLISFFTLSVISYYLMEDRPNLKKHLDFLFGVKKGDILYKVMSQLEIRLGAWVRGEIFLMIIVGLLNYIGFMLIGIPSAIPLAVIAGVLELVPNIGPTIAAVPAVIVGFSISPTHGFLALGLAILVQQLENNVIVPKIMQRAVDLHPVVTIISLLIGFQLGGPALAVLSLPIVLSLQIILKHLKTEPKNEEIEIC